MSHYSPTSTKASPRYNSLDRIYVWRCRVEECKFVNETLASEEGYVRIIASGDELREPMWYGEKCEMCRERAGRGCCLLETKPLPRSQPAGEAKGKGKAPVDEESHMEG